MRKFVTIAAIAALAACSQGQDLGEAEADAQAGPAATEATTAAPSSEPSMAYDGPIPHPIKIGGEAEMDACGTAAKVANLNPDGDNYLSVRDAPSVETKERDRLDPDQMVSVCDTAGEWSGVVYSKDSEQAKDCGTGTPVATEQNYIGPCAQGWVKSEYLEMVAG